MILRQLHYAGNAMLVTPRRSRSLVHVRARILSSPAGATPATSFASRALHATSVHPLLHSAPVGCSPFARLGASAPCARAAGPVGGAAPRAADSAQRSQRFPADVGELARRRRGRRGPQPRARAAG